MSSSVTPLRDWIRARPLPERPWLILGKGPTFAARDRFDLGSFNLASLNHVVREQRVDVAHFIDLDAAIACEAELPAHAEWLVLPYHPHVRFQPTAETLDQLAVEVPVLREFARRGRLVGYWHDLEWRPDLKRGYPADADPIIPVNAFSAEAVVGILGALGARCIRTLGIDGGNDYARDFQDLHAVTRLANGQESFDLQFIGIERAAKSFGIDYGPLVEPMRVYVGTDESQMVAAQVLAYSIRRYASRPVEIVPMLNLPVPLPKDAANRPRTGFSYARFLIPDLAGRRGKAIYLDADMLVFADIAELWETPLGAHRVLCARQDTPPPSWRTNEHFQPGRQMSVLLIDCAACTWSIDEIVRDLDAGRYSYEELMFDLCIVPEAAIGDTLDPSWNSLEHLVAGTTKLLHFTDMAMQPWRHDHNPLGEVWRAYFRAAVEEGAVEPALVEHGIAEGWLLPALARDLAAAPRAAGPANALAGVPSVRRRALELENAALRAERAALRSQVADLESDARGARADARSDATRPAPARAAQPPGRAREGSRLGHVAALARRLVSPRRARRAGDSAAVPTLQSLGIDAALAERVRRSGLFDAAWYVRKFPDVAAAGMDPLAHFMAYGWKEGRDPGPRFPLAAYARSHPEVVAAGTNPLVDHLARPPSRPAVLVSWYVATADPPAPIAAVTGTARAREIRAIAYRYAWTPDDGSDPETVLQSLPPDVAFCIAWSNGDIGEPAHTLAAHLTFFRHLLPLLRDPRYFTWRRRPVLIVQRIDRWRDPAATAAAWRDEARRAGLPGVYLCVEEPGAVGLQALGFDASAGPDGFDELRFVPWHDAVGAHAPPTGHRGFIPWHPLPGQATPPSGTRRVLLVSHDAERSGAQLILLGLTTRLARHPHFEPWVLLRGGGPLEEDFRRFAPTVRIDQYGGGTVPHDVIVDEIVADFAARGPAIAWCNTILSGDVAAACDRHGIPVVSQVLELPTSIAAMGDAPAVRRLLRHSQRVVVASDFARTALACAYGLASESLLVLRNGVPLERFPPSFRTTARTEVLRDLGFPADAFVVLGCGTIHPRKGTDLFVRVAAATLARPDGRRARFVWVGSDAAPDHFPDWCRHDLARMGLRDALVLTGEREDVARFFAAADAFALTSREDPFPTVALEAMAAGLPTVAFAESGGAGEALGDEAGIFVPYLDVEAMARELAELAAEPARAAAIGRAARTRVERLFSIDRFHAEVLALLEEVGAPLDAYGGTS